MPEKDLRFGGAWVWGLAKRRGRFATAWLLGLLGLLGLLLFFWGRGPAADVERGSWAQNCEAALLWEGELYCASDLLRLAERLQREELQSFQFRPGESYEMAGRLPRTKGTLPPAWLRSFAVGVWLHGDRDPWLRSLRGFASRRIAAWRRYCAPLQCCDPTGVSGIGDKSVRAWRGRARADPLDIACWWWHRGAFATAPCVL